MNSFWCCIGYACGPLFTAVTVGESGKNICCGKRSLSFLFVVTIALTFLRPLLSLCECHLRIQMHFTHHVFVVDDLFVDHHLHLHSVILRSKANSTFTFNFCIFHRFLPPYKYCSYHQLSRTKIVNHDLPILSLLLWIYEEMVWQVNHAMKEECQHRAITW